MSKIKFIYFDLGNVILHFSHQRMIDQVAKVASVDAATVEEFMFANDLENRYETGEYNSHQFHEEFCRLAGATCDKDNFIEACGDIFWLNGEIATVISQLWTVGIPLGILSNTCEAHWQVANRNFAVLGDFFNTFITSYESKSMKPDAKIYTDAIKASGFEAEEIFFTDDKPENIAAAADAGIDAVLFTSADDLSRELIARGIRIG